MSGFRARARLGSISKQKNKSYFDLERTIKALTSPSFSEVTMDSTREEDDLEEGPLSDLSSQPEEEGAGEAGATGDEEKPPCFAHLLRKLGH